MNIQPYFIETICNPADPEKNWATATPDELIECCDSMVAVLTDAEIINWVIEFRAAAADLNTTEWYGDYASTMIFEISGEKLVVVVDGGMVGLADAFEAFCLNSNITCLGFVDSLDFADVDVDDMYTGYVEDDRHLLTLVNAITN
jgi:hypothetical protein